MVNTNAFSSGTQEGNWWANYVATAPEREAKKSEEEAARVSAQRAMIDRYQREQALKYAAPAITSVIQTYTVKGEMADTDTVASDVSQMLPDAAPGLFRQVLDDLKSQGKVYEVQNAPGFMGMRSSHLYLVDR
ncbi:hypothetical protein [Streptomyces dioscori]|uniref:hypothetical protein n=1 Tax=Streptomyces dioscori TaxID=2109333 RepID=UPI00131CE130|nr:hypothetical protein [Streptomyces dioscori]